MANTNPHIIAFFCAWLRRFYDIDESRVCAFGSTSMRDSTLTRQPDTGRR